jgi:hypothetical protein
MMTLFAMICVAVISAIGGHAYGEAERELLKNAHKKEMEEAFVEVKRLRAQVANLIGRE